MYSTCKPTPQYNYVNAGIINELYLPKNMPVHLRCYVEHLSLSSTIKYQYQTLTQN